MTRTSVKWRHLAFVTAFYPSRAHPNSGAFVRQLVGAVAEQGVRCTVVHPWRLHEWICEGWRCPKGEGSETRLGRCEITVHRPVTVSVSNRRLGPFNTFSITHASFRRAVWRVLRRLPEVPDAVYGHFLYSAGATAVGAGRRLQRPGFVAVGESYAPEEPGLWTLRAVGAAAARRDLDGAAGFVVVSSLLRRQLQAELGVAAARIGVFPNGVDPRRFHPRDRQAMRQKHGLPQDRCLLAFVGAFDQRKGIRRVCEAMRGTPQLAGIFVGQGPLAPTGDQVAFCGRVPHEQVPELLAAADFFVLPSLAEGSSNATLEAMACGLPVVVANREFNQDICDAESALLVEPEDVEAIGAAIRGLQHDGELRRRLGASALARAREFDVRRRAQRILEWMGQAAEADGWVCRGGAIGHGLSMESRR